MATNNGDLLTPELEAEIQSLAKEENRTPMEVMEAALKAYRLQRLAAYGKAKVKELGLRPRSEAHAERMVNKAVREVREEERGR
jgi:predicted transcriptional regulator